MDTVDRRRDHTIGVLRSSGAAFAILFGSHARGTAGPASDLDAASWWPGDAPEPWELELPAGVDLVNVERAPRAGRSNRR